MIVNHLRLLPDEVFFNTCDFVNDKELVQLYLTCHYYFDQLPHHVSGLRQLQAPIERRRNIVKFIEAIKILLECKRSFVLKLDIDELRSLRSLEDAEKELKLTA